MKIIFFIEDHKVIDRIIHHLKFMFYSEHLPPSQVFQCELLMAAEEREEYYGESKVHTKTKFLSSSVS